MVIRTVQHLVALALVLTGDLTSSACVCGCSVNGVNDRAATYIYYFLFIADYERFYCSIIIVGVPHAKNVQ